MAAQQLTTTTGGRTSKVYVATVEEFDLRHGADLHKARRFDLQAVHLPEGSQLSPSGPRVDHLPRHRYRAGAAVHVTVTTTQAGHMALLEAGFRAPADKRELYEIVHEERRREHAEWQAKITGKPVPVTAAAVADDVAAVTDHASVTASHPDVEAF